MVVPIIVRGAQVVGKGTRAVSKSSGQVLRNEKGKSDTPDIDRGIQNTTARFKETTEDRLLSTKFQQKGRSQEKNKDRTDEYTDEETSRDTPENTKNPLQKIKNVRALLKKGGMWVSVSILLWLAVLQFFFGIMSLAGFGLHGFAVYVRNQTWLGKIAGFFIEFQNYLPFEFFGYGFWAFNIIITFGIFIYYSFNFVMNGINPYDTSIHFFLTAVCLALNFMPITNIFPWLECWALYWITRGTLATVHSLSNT